MREKVVCPICGSRLMDKSLDRNIKAYKESETKLKMDLFQKCHKCHNIIGIKID